MPADPIPSTLARVRPDHWVTVRAVGGERAFRRRLLEMGFLPGTPVRLVGVAPLGDPMEFELRGGRLSIRRSEADRVEISA